MTSPTTLDVFNFARKGSVEGEPSNEDMVLYAFIPDVDVKSKLKVGPKFVPRALYGDYWIVAYEEEEGWAIISGGQPTIFVSDGLCTTESANNVRNQGGLWLFTREKGVSEELIETMKKKRTRWASIRACWLRFSKQDASIRKHLSTADLSYSTFCTYKELLHTNIQTLSKI